MYMDTHPQVRQTTNRLIEAVEDGALSWEAIARSCLRYLSEADVADMAHVELLLEVEDD